MHPRISIIIPTYNRAEFVRTCLISLAASGIGTSGDYEAIVVDDGSKDNTAEVVTRMAEAGHPVKYIVQANAGPAAARNNGFQHSRGEYICFLDCDDEWLPGQATQALGFLDRHPEVHLLFCDAQMGNHQEGFRSFVEMAGQKRFFELPHNPIEPGFRILEREPFFERMVVRNAVFLGSTIMRRQAFENVGPFDTRLCGAADWNLWLRMSQRLYFAYWQEPLAIYTQHPGGMSNDSDGMNREFCLALEYLTQQIPLDNRQKNLVERQWKHHLFGLAYKAYNRGDWPLARQRFREVGRKTGWDRRTTLYWGLTRLPLGKLLRKAKQTVAGTAEPVSQPQNVISSALRPEQVPV